MAGRMGMVFLAWALASSPAAADYWDHGDRIEGEGPVKREARRVGPVDAVELGTIGTLYIEQADSTSLYVEAQENLLEYLETDVRSGVLVIRAHPRRNLQSDEPIEYHLTLPRLEELILSSSGDAVLASWKGDRLILTLESSGDLDCDSLSCPTLDVELESSGDLTIRVWQGETLEARLSSSGDCKIGGGHARELDVEINSSGDFSAAGLECDEASVSTQSSGDAVVRVTEFLSARTSSSGDVVYYGDPEVDARSSSSGDVVRRGR